MTIPLTVRVGDTHITRRVDDLTFSANVHGAAECGFNRADPLHTQVAAFERVYVYDGRSGDTAWEGRLEDPGRTTGDQGTRWDMSAIGVLARASDRSAAYILVDRDLTRYERRGKLVPSATAEVRDNAGETTADAIHLQFNPGQPIDASSFITMIYPTMYDAGMLLGGFGYSWDTGFGSGASPGSHQLQVDVEGETLPQVNVRTHPFNSAGGVDSAQLTGAPYTGAQTLVLRHNRIDAATNVATEDRWGSFYNLYVVALRLNKDGTTNLTSADYLRDHVFAHEVVADLLGRLLGDAYDGATAEIDATATHPIDQWAFPDGTTAEHQLAELMALERDFYWQVGPSDPATGKASFVWRRWPTHARYSASLRDGISLPGADAERFNRVTVRWKNRAGRTMTHTYDAGTTINGVAVPVVAELETAGPNGTRLVRQPEVQDLADEVGSSAAADKLAAEFLTEHGTPPVSGELTVARRIWDADEGRMVDPWEIQPGHLVRVRELVTDVDDLMEEGRDGKCCFRIVGRSYQISDNVARLELDAPPRTDRNLLAAQISSRQRKR